MRNFQDTFETCKRSFISAFLICMTLLLTKLIETKPYGDYGDFMEQWLVTAFPIQEFVIITTEWFLVQLRL